MKNLIIFCLCDTWYLDRESSRTFHSLSATDSFVAHLSSAESTLQRGGGSLKIVERELSQMTIYMYKTKNCSCQPVGY